MPAKQDWQPFGLPPGAYEPWPRSDGQVRIANLRLGGGKPKDRAGAWLRCAGVAVGVLAAGAAVVSYQAQWQLIFAYKHRAVVSFVQAGIPDVGSVVFACLGIALALHGQRALRARALNVVCVGVSIAMNAIAAAPGWAATAVWVMAPCIYALACDTLIGVVRAYVIARQRALDETFADEGVTPLQVVGGLLLWLLRLALAPPSTLRGFRVWVVSTPAAPRACAVAAAEPGATEPPRAQPVTSPRRGSGAGRGGTKAAALIILAAGRHELAALPLSRVSAIATELAPEARLHPSTARRVLLGHVRALQNGGRS
jgi:hypothetical protein